MKYRFKLINKLEELTNKQNKSIIKRNSNNRVLVDKIYKISEVYFKKYNLKNYNSTSARMHLLKYGLPICKNPNCNNHVLNRLSVCCSYNCSGTMFHLNESITDKQIRLQSAASNRDYTAISKKRVETMKNDIDENGLNGIERAQVKSKNTMQNDIDENGLNMFSRRALKASKTIGDTGYTSIVLKSQETSKKNGSNGSKTYWDSLTEDFKKLEVGRRSKKQLETKIKSGIISSPECIKPYIIYFKAASFKHGFKTNNEDEIRLLEDYGVFNSITNTKGCVRDHLLSRRYGFENNIPTWIISHPANCQIVLHTENVRRASTNDNLITLEELLERIEKWE